MKLSSPCLVLWTLLWLAAATGCAAHRVATEKPENQAGRALSGYRISASIDPVLGVRIWDAETVFDKAETGFDAGDYSSALLLYHRVVDEFPESTFVAPALLMLGRTETVLSNHETAITWYQRYLDEYPQGIQRWFAWKEISDCYAANEQWVASEQATVSLLSLPGLDQDTVDSGKVRLARARIEQGHVDDAMTDLESVVVRHGPTARLKDGSPDDSDTGPIAEYYLGEIARIQAQDISIEPEQNTEKIDRALNRKIELTLEAHHHYYRTLIYGEPFWTAAAAFRMGYIYERFYLDLMETSIPSEVGDEDATLYLEVLSEQLSSVIKRARDLYEQVVTNAERLNLDEAWVVRCQEGIARLETWLNETRSENAPSEPPNMHSESDEDTSPRKDNHSTSPTSI